MNSPLISIGLTVYNAVDTLERAIESALLQSWNNVEIIAVDDVSTDGSYELLLALEKKIPELLVFCNKTNSGVAFSRNHIIEKASGEFIAFFDDDDFSLPSRLEEQYNRIVQYEKQFAKDQMVLCHTAREVVYSNGSIRTEFTMGQDIGKLAPHGISVARRILYGEHVKGGYGSCATCSQMARTSTYKSLSGFDVELRRGEDTDFSIRLSIEGGHFVGLSDSLVRQFMTKTPEKSLADEHRYTLMILSKYRSLAKSRCEYEFAHDWIDLKYEILGKNYVGFMRLFFLLVTKHPILTIKRILSSLPSIDTNVAFSRFHH